LRFSAAAHMPAKQPLDSGTLSPALAAVPSSRGQRVGSLRSTLERSRSPLRGTLFSQVSSGDATPQATARWAWRASDQLAWLDEETYLRKIQPRLADVMVPAISSALGISQPYAAEIRAGRCRPHPRHWLTLVRLVGVSQDE